MAFFESLARLLLCKAEEGDLEGQMAVVKPHKAGLAGVGVRNVEAPKSKATPAARGGDHVAHGELPKAPKMPVGVRAGRFGSAAQALGKDPVAKLLARFDGLPDSEAAAMLADAIMNRLEIA